MSLRILGLAAMALLLSACATRRDRILLLPGPDGRAGAVAVLEPDGSSTLLDVAYDSVEIDNLGQIRRRAGEGSGSRDTYQETLGALPARPVLYMLYFKTDTDELTEESKSEAPEMLQEVASRPAAEVVVIGHTDRYGPVEYNDELSRARAAEVRRQLIELGFDESYLLVEGRGEREPLVPTPDEVRESNNRRAEINVR